MFDTKTLEATPANARRLIQFAKFKNIEISPELEALARQDQVDPEAFNGTSFSIDAAGIEMVQHILDWKGRGMVLDNGDYQSRQAALGALWLKPKGRTIILTRPNVYALWASLIQKQWPTSKISVFGNPRYEEKSQIYPTGISFKEEPDLDADWLITSYGSLIWHNVVGKTDIGQVIVEEIDSDQSLNYRWDDALRGILGEVASVLFLQNILAMDSSIAVALNSLHEQNGRLSRHIQRISSSYLWPFAAPLVNLQDFSTARDSIRYLSERGYNNIQPLTLLPSLGISTAAISNAAGRSAPLVFTDKSVHDVKVIKSMAKTTSPYLRMITREDGLEAHTGQSIEALVRDCLDGDTRAAELLRGLQTVQYGNLKAPFIAQNLDRLTSKVSRSLVVCESPELERSLCVTLKSAQRITTRAPEDVRTQSIGQYLFPNESHKQYLEKVGYSLNTLIVDSTTIANDDIVDFTSYLVIGDPIMTLDTYRFYVELSKQRDLRLVHFILQGTFEEYFFKAFNNLPQN